MLPAQVILAPEAIKFVATVVTRQTRRQVFSAFPAQSKKKTAIRSQAGCGELPSWSRQSGVPSGMDWF